MPRFTHTATAVAALATLVTACSERATGPTVQQCGATADVVGSFAPGGALPSSVVADIGPTPASAAAATLSIAPLNGAIVSYPAASAQLNDTSARYLVIPQYPVQGTTPDSTAFKLTVGTGALAVAAQYAAAPVAGPQLQDQMDLRLRGVEAKLPWTAGLDLYGRGPMRVAGAATAPDSLRSFYVLGSITGNCFVKTQARLRYSGSRVYLYEDTGVPTADSLTTSEYASFGKLFDDVLYPIDTAAFGSPSDFDGNGHIIVLLSQRINALTKAADCPTKGYVAGYFFGYDLTNGSGANHGEIFYSVAPDSAGKFSCKHPKDQVKTGTPPTFIHEFQHMISYNQHVLVRGGQAEVTWLNEGLSHIAEELGAKYYEAKYPTGMRTNPSAPWPDSADAFVRPDFRNAYNYLLAPRKHSVTTFADLGTLEERGAAWLFLRWLGDQKGDAIYRTMVQTTKRGIDNVSSAAGEPFPALFGDFGIATYTDSINGVPRSSVPTRYRFTSRNTRQIFGRFFPTKPNPITPTLLSCSASSTQSMVQGTSAYFVVGGTIGCSQTQLDLTAATGAALPSSLQPQLAIFRLP